VKLLFAQSAFNDFAEIKAYYQEQGIPAIGDRLVTEIIAHVEVLIDHPEIGRMVPELSEPKVRELIYNPFRIV
jgi:toxin ParE1/3/4